LGQQEFTTEEAERVKKSGAVYPIDTNSMQLPCCSAHDVIAEAKDSKKNE
jgi:hypothetical protein